MAKIKARKTKVQSWYLDLTMIEKYWGSDRFYHHTAPISMNYAIFEALGMVLEEGLEARHARHLLNHQALAAGIDALGMKYFTQQGHRLPQLNCVVIPDGVDDMTVRRRLLAEWGIEIGGGLGPVKGKAWRIGLMGEAAKKSNVLLFLAALEQCLNRQGIKPSPGASIAAANAVYCS